VNDLSPRQVSLLSAAVRHVADAERLLAPPPSSPDQAWHLAGYGPECARKACIDEEILDRTLRHGWGSQGEVLLEWWIPLDPAAWRYRLGGWAERAPRLADWSPSHRYERTGTRGDAPARELTTSAGALVDAVVADLWADGRLSEGAL
jgi:hypothetical protein